MFFIRACSCREGMKLSLLPPSRHLSAALALGCAAPAISSCNGAADCFGAERAVGDCCLLSFLKGRGSPCPSPQPPSSSLGHCHTQLQGTGQEQRHAAKAPQSSRRGEPAASTELTLQCGPQPCTCAGQITSGSRGLFVPSWSLCQIPTSCFTVSCKPSQIHEFIGICTVRGSGSIYQCNTLLACGVTQTIAMVWLAPNTPMN